MAQHAPDFLRRTDIQLVTEGPWDDSLPPKNWIDSSASTISSTSYNGVGSSGLQKFILLPSQRGANIPPVAKVIPPYVVEPTVATSDGQGINPEYLSTPIQAAELCTLTGAARFFLQDSETNSYGMETRRIWVLQFGDQVINVGQLLKEQGNQTGTWNGLTFTPDPNVLIVPSLPPVEWPLRDLQGSEKTVPGPFGYSWLVDDGVSGSAATTPSSPTYSEQLNRIESKLDRLMAGVGIK